MKAQENKVKRILVMIALVIGMICPMQLSATGRGEKSVGLSAGYAGYNSSGYISANFQYTFADHFRLAPEIGYVFYNQGATGFKVDADMHFPFRVAKGLGLYPLAGLTFNNWSFSRSPLHENIMRFGVDAGVGLDLYLTNSLKLNFQAKYSLMKNCSGLFTGIGIGYIF